MQVTDAMVAKAHAEYHKVLGEKNRSYPMRAALTAALAEMWRPVDEFDGVSEPVVLATRDEWRPFVVAKLEVDARGSYFEDTDGNYYSRFEPTHFMPLPPPPMGRG